MVKNKRKHLAMICPECEEEYFFILTDLIEHNFNMKCKRCNSKLILNQTDNVVTYKK